MPNLDAVRAPGEPCACCMVTLCFKSLLLKRPHLAFLTLVLWLSTPDGRLVTALPLAAPPSFPQGVAHWGWKA
eukprot:6219430-Amphidinium_carterae.1